MDENLKPANQPENNPAGDQQPIHCGAKRVRIGSNMWTAWQCFDEMGRLLLFESDADNDTLARVLEITQQLEAWRARLSPEPPKITAAQRNHQ